MRLQKFEKFLFSFNFSRHVILTPLIVSSYAVKYTHKANKQKSEKVVLLKEEFVILRVYPWGAFHSKMLTKGESLKKIFFALLFFCDLQKWKKHLTHKICQLNQIYVEFWIQELEYNYPFKLSRKRLSGRWKKRCWEFTSNWIFSTN